MQINIDVKGHIMTNTEYLNSIKEMIIDETKDSVTYRLELQNQISRTNTPIIM